MPLENHFYGSRSSRLFVLRRRDAGAIGAGNVLAERSEGAGRRSCGKIYPSLVPSGPPAANDGTTRAPSDRSWRAIPAAVYAVTAKTVAVLGACDELPVCRVLLAILSWIFEQALEGCAAYATVMYGIPADEFRDRRDPPEQLQTRREHAIRLVSHSPTEISRNAKDHIPWTAGSKPAAPEADFIAPPLAPRMGASGRTASIRSIAVKIRRLFDRRRATAQLQSFDDRGLRDVGIYRSDIEYLMRHGDRRE